MLYFAFGLHKFSENRIFTDADDYSMEIELPLADCPQNLADYAKVINPSENLPQEIRNWEFYKKSQRTAIEAVRFGGSRDGVASTNPSALQR